jgi:PAS domain S-box-containing protein
MSMRDAHAPFERRPVGVVRVKDRKILWSNDAFAGLFGYRCDELVGRPTRILYPDDAEYERFGELAYASMSRGEVFRTESPRVRVDGSVDGGSKPTAAVASFVDFTEKREAFERIR